MSGELQQLIEEQARDNRFGNRVHSISLDATLQDGNRTFGEIVEAPEGIGIRRERATKRIKGMLSYRTRERQRRRKYGAVCECGAITDGSNGRAKAPARCATCVRADKAATLAAEPHGTLKKYWGGCRCQECRWENARDAWDRQKRRKASATA